MAGFAVIVDGIVTNIVEAESQAIAEELTGAVCVESLPGNIPHIGGEYVDGFFYEPQPFPSWVRNGMGKWFPPVSHPGFDMENPVHYRWNEESLSWNVDITSEESVEYSYLLPESGPTLE